MSANSGKLVVQIGYSSFVMDASDAITALQALSKAEKYEQKYHPAKDGKESFHTQHIYSFEDMDSVSTRLITEGLYNMAKLAGKPSND